MAGYSATVTVEDPAGCPVASVSDTTGAPVDSVTRSAQLTTDGTVVEEFDVETGAVSADGQLETEYELTPITETDQFTAYRFERDADAGCVCTVVERTGTPVESIRATEGGLHVTFRTVDLDTVVTIVDELRQHFDGVTVHELSQSGPDPAADVVSVDRDQLTERQREVLERAYRLGYFEYPKGANASEVANELDISRSTFTEHIATAQTKLLSSIIDE